MTRGSAFIAYVRENLPLVQRLSVDLASAGIRTWLDRDNINPGQPWKIAIRKALARGSCLVACFSANYGTRKPTYMDEEIAFAAELRRYQGQTNWFVPVLLSPCNLPTIYISPNQLVADLNAVDLTEDWEGGVNRIADMAVRIESRNIASRLEFYRNRTPSWTLRAEPRNLSDNDVSAMIRGQDCYERNVNPSKGSGALAQLQFLDSDTESVALDLSTGLLWHVNRDRVDIIPHRDIDDWLARLNHASYAGFDHWRLPTLPEAMSLIETGGHHDHRFGYRLSVWTSDTTETGSVWVVGYRHGECGRLDTHDFHRLSVRAVCSWRSLD